MLIFSEAARLAHPQARLIPEKMWRGQFYCELSDNQLMIMQPDSMHNLARVREAFQATKTAHSRRMTAICLLIAHQNAFETLIENAKTFNLSPDDLLYIAVSFGRSDWVQAITTRSSYTFELPEIFDQACRYGSQSVIEQLMALVPNIQVVRMITNANCSLFARVAVDGNLPVMELFMARAPHEVQNMIKSQDYYSFRGAAEYNHVHIVNRLLLFPTMLAYAEQHEREYGEKYTHPFISQQLSLLRTQQHTLETEQTHAVFNLNEEQAQLCFYMLRNLIRRNNTTLQDDILFLLNIPAVKALVHTAVTPNQPNELVRLALTTGNQNAAALLLTIPEVRAQAEQNNFYRQESRGGFDLRAVAQDAESSMRALSAGEQLRLSSATARYEPVMKAHGIEPLFQGLRDQLKARYAANPAFIQTGDGRTVDLPLDWNEWCRLSQTLNADTRERALQAYYQHKDHTALRYLSKPNPWIAANAAYVNRGEGGQGWSTFEEYKPLITMLWLAAKDTSSDITVAPTDGYTVETRIDRFIDEIALLGRAHNWDERRFKMDAEGNLLVDEDNNPVMEEYDDVQGDKPSCYSGVKRRLFQSVLGHPLLKILTMDDIKQELRDVVRDYFKQHITNQNIQVIHDAWANLCEANPYNAVTHACLNELNLPAAAQRAFIEHLIEKYPTQFNQDPEFKAYIEQRFKLDDMCPTHASRFGGETNLDGLLTLPAATDISSQSILKAKTRLNSHGELGQSIIAEIQCLQRGCNSQSQIAWSGSKEKLAAILAAVNALSDVTAESLTQHLTNEQSALSQALFRRLATRANDQNPDETQMQAIQVSLAECQAQETKMFR